VRSPLCQDSRKIRILTFPSQLGSSRIYRDIAKSVKTYERILAKTSDISTYQSNRWLLNAFMIINISEWTTLVTVLLKLHVIVWAFLFTERLTRHKRLCSSCQQDVVPSNTFKFINPAAFIWKHCSGCII
jgi:uncharacterized protein with PIN domain